MERAHMTLASALSTLNHSLTRLINENVDHEISDDADLINAYLKASPECADLFALWEYQLTVRSLSHFPLHRRPSPHRFHAEFNRSHCSCHNKCHRSHHHRIETSRCSPNGLHRR